MVFLSPNVLNQPSLPSTGTGNAPSARLQRPSDADADDRAVPLRPSSPALAEPEHAYD